MRDVFAISEACNVLGSQSLCEVVVSSCRSEVQSKSSVVFRVSYCRSGILSLSPAYRVGWGVAFRESYY